eukprot:CAMPEP_0182813418 /NCGR_PEP_ID=MMETSP0006_2-20121128/9322_1 /TAXON_ID=97485 /ORGANISM="Prymnesium parvum, Strain Texoma1" /LENGTH=190 /DNA_ID=CAMNT_0024939499 /DNA_START=19 /DNA_END=591 /DNA_ORIENTATION=-
MPEPSLAQCVAPQGYPVVEPPRPPPPPSRKERLPLPEGVFEDLKSLDSEDATSLRFILQSLYDDDAIEDFMDAHCAKFEDYGGADGEQRLEWSQLHTMYQSLMESQIETYAQQTKLQNSERLYLLLRQVSGLDAHASDFIARILSQGEYKYFCEIMAARRRDAIALEAFQEKALRIQLEMTRLDANLGMD